MSEMESDNEVLTLLPNPAPISKSVVAEGSDVSAIAHDAFSSTERHACSIWVKTSVGEGWGMTRVFEWLKMGDFTMFSSFWTNRVCFKRWGNDGR